ncbi:MAG: hypothetical protein H6625_12860 [Bdellovibrionaceae bacterium]|nr:hypothetical protein [Pseudobdellovibrionaceae bacterium]
MRNFNLNILLLALFSCKALATPISYGFRDGYTYEVKKERYTRVYEIPLVTEPQSQHPPLKKMIFVPRLTKEFKERYEQTFGFTDIQRNVSVPNQYAEQEYQPGVWVTPEEDQRRRESFGNYMVKRLTEHHVDEYFKSNPSVRPIYELKEKISHIDLEVKKGYKVYLHYSYSGNYLNLKVDNPYDVQSRITLEMNPEQVGPSEVQEARLFLGYNLSNDVIISTDYTFNDGDLSIIGSRYLGNQIYASLTGIADLREGGNTKNNTLTGSRPDIEGEKRILVGLTWSH